MAVNKLDRVRRLLLRAVDLVSDDDGAANRESSTASSSSSSFRASLSATAPLDGQSTLRLRRESVQVPSRENRATQVREEQHGCSGLTQKREESERQPQQRQAQQ